MDACANDPALSPRESLEEFHSCFKKQEKFLRIPNNYTIGQFKDGIDKLYADYRNCLITVDFIAEDAEKQINGASDQEIEADLEIERRAAQQLTTHAPSKRGAK